MISNTYGRNDIKNSMCLIPMPCRNKGQSLRVCPHCVDSLIINTISSQYNDRPGMSTNKGKEQLVHKIGHLTPSTGTDAENSHLLLYFTAFALILPCQHLSQDVPCCLLSSTETVVPNNICEVKSDFILRGALDLIYYCTFL